MLNVSPLGFKSVEVKYVKNGQKETITGQDANIIAQPGQKNSIRIEVIKDRTDK